MRIVVVGGGTAGFMAACLARSLMPGVPVSVVRSTEIGTVGAGEGTTPYFLSGFADEVGLPPAALVRDAGATFKLAVRFLGWRGEGSVYHHPFDGRGSIGLDLRLIDPDGATDLASLHLLSRLADRGRVPLARPADGAPASDPNLGGLDRVGDFAVHFDASQLAIVLERHAVQLGAEVIEGKVVQAVQRPDGGLAAIRLADGRQLAGDLFLDCTGFRRLLIGKVLRTPWIDVHDALPVRRALTFALPIDRTPLPLTDAIALRAGWAWKIPVRGRYGCGYVFDPEFATDDEAAAEVQARFPLADLGRVIEFQAGYYERIWQRNVVAIGLSAGFLEPLEATSIWHALQTLRELFGIYLPIGDDAARGDFNRFHRTFMERTVAFLHAHYLTDRADTPFWATFADRTRRPELLTALLRGGRYRWLTYPPPELAGHPNPFPMNSWNQIALGTGLSCPQTHRAYWNWFNLRQEHAGRVAEHARALQAIEDRCLTHAQALAMAGGEPLDQARSTARAHAAREAAIS